MGVLSEEESEASSEDDAAVPESQEGHGIEHKKGGKPDSDSREPATEESVVVADGESQEGKAEQGLTEESVDVDDTQEEEAALDEQVDFSNGGGESNHVFDFQNLFHAIVAKTGKKTVLFQKRKIYHRLRPPKYRIPLDPPMEVNIYIQIGRSPSLNLERNWPLIVP
jgi:hypothetical protein